MDLMHKYGKNDVAKQVEQFGGGLVDCVKHVLKQLHNNGVSAMEEVIENLVGIFGRVCGVVVKRDPRHQKLVFLENHYCDAKTLARHGFLRECRMAIMELVQTTTGVHCYSTDGVMV